MLLLLWLLLDGGAVAAATTAAYCGGGAAAAARFEVDESAMVVRSSIAVVARGTEKLARVIHRMFN